MRQSPSGAFERSAGAARLGDDFEGLAPLAKFDLLLRSRPFSNGYSGGMRLRRASGLIVVSLLSCTAWSQDGGRDKEYRAEMLGEVERQAREATTAIGEVLGAMSEAVARGDDAAYLEHIWTGDEVFATEQRAWAKDLTRHVPEAFELIASDIQETPVACGAMDGHAVRLANATLTARWRMAGGSDRKVSYLTKFVERDGRWLYAGRAWETLETDGIRVHYADGLEDTARRVLEDLPEIIEHVHEGFELPIDPQRVQEVKLYRSMRELQFAIYPSYVESLSGWNEPGESIKMLTSPRAGGRQIRALLAHEYGHVASFLLGDRIVEAPWWVLEGIAELAAEGYGMSWRATDRRMRQIARDGGIVEWERMADFHGVEPAVMRMAYLQGHHIMGYVSERFGRSARNAWLRAFARGKPLDDATREVFGMGFDALDRDWRASLTGDRNDSGEPPSGEPIPSADG